LFDLQTGLPGRALLGGAQAMAHVATSAMKKNAMNRMM
jgi:hypothetical protein